MTRPVLGVDIGGVIISHIPDETGYYPPLPQSFEVLKLLNVKFSGRVFLVYRLDLHSETDVRWWLCTHDFHEFTGIGAEKLCFCRLRTDKAKICRKLGITHFIDDRKEVLSYLYAAGVPNLYLFQGGKEEEGKFMEILPLVTPVASWNEAAVKLLS